MEGVWRAPTRPPAVMTPLNIRRCQVRRLPAEHRGANARFGTAFPAPRGGVSEVTELDTRRYALTVHTLIGPTVGQECATGGAGGYDLCGRTIAGPVRPVTGRPMRPRHRTARDISRDFLPVERPLALSRAMMRPGSHPALSVRRPGSRGTVTRLAHGVRCRVSYCGTKVVRSRRRPEYAVTILDAQDGQSFGPLGRLVVHPH